MFSIVDFTNFDVKSPRELIDEESNCRSRRPPAGSSRPGKPGPRSAEGSGLDLCSCELTTLDGIAELASASLWQPERFVYLDLSGNKLTSVQELASLTTLRILYLQGNRIEDVRALAPLRALESLDSLSIAGNPLVAQEHYRQWIIVNLPQVKRIDKQAVTRFDREDAETLDRLHGITLKRRANVVLK